jgi:ADP-ribose pyrophosphatase
VSPEFEITAVTPLLQSYIFDVERRDVAHHGEVFSRDVVVHPGAVAIVCIDALGRVAVVRQWRSTFDRTLLEIPAGTCDSVGESPLETAQRELREEIGAQAKHWEQLGQFLVSPGWTTQVMTIFLATEIELVGRATEGPEESASSVEWLTADQVSSLLTDGSPVDFTSFVGLTEYLRRVHG